MPQMTFQIIEGVTVIWANNVWSHYCSTEFSKNQAIETISSEKIPEFDG
jgi:hypothetical protein